MPLVFGGINPLCHLLCEGVDRSSIPVPLTIDGRLGTPSDRIHLPVGVVVVHYMKVTMSTPEIEVNSCILLIRGLFRKKNSVFCYVPRHPLDQTFAEMVVRDCHLHLLVEHVRITVPQQHYLFVISTRLSISSLKYFSKGKMGDSVTVTNLVVMSEIVVRNCYRG